MPEYHLDPEVVLIGFLPPLLYAAALRTSLVDVRANRQAIGILAVGAVVFTTVVVGLVAWAVIPGVSLAAAFALGAVVSPPDAVAATTIARKVGMPRRIVVDPRGREPAQRRDRPGRAAHDDRRDRHARSPCSRSAATSSLAAGGGIVVGLAVAAVLAAARKRVQDPVLDTTLSLVAPFITYLAAEAVDASGVLAVVIVGLLLGHKSPALQSASSRLAEQTNWRTITFVLENAVFLLIGLQVQQVVRERDRRRLRRLPARPDLRGRPARDPADPDRLGVRRDGRLPVRHRRRCASSAWSWSHATLVSWAGMRGVVTLAAAFVLPDETPHRDVLVLAAFAVVGGTLLVNGTTLPWLVRRLDLPGPDPAEDALEEAALLSKATRAGLARLEELKAEGDDPAVIERLEERTRSRADAAWERLGRAERRRDAQRAVPPAAPGDAARRARASCSRRATAARSTTRCCATCSTCSTPRSRCSTGSRTRAATVERELVARIDRAEDCEHLKQAPVSVRPNTPEGCEECLRDGTHWVHLRLCLTCGHVGCCDSSPQRHADRALPRDRAPGDAQLRDRRGLALVLRRRAPGLSCGRQVLTRRGDQARGLIGVQADLGDRLGAAAHRDSERSPEPDVDVGAAAHHHVEHHRLLVAVELDRLPGVAAALAHSDRGDGLPRHSEVDAGAPA